MKNKIIPYGRHHITEEDIDSVVKVLKSDNLTQGPNIKYFEEEFSIYVGSKYAVAVSNGTAALHLSVLSMNLSPGDKVITTPLTFAASANCIRYCGAEVIFVDIDPETYLIDMDKIEEKLKLDSEKKIKGIIPVNFAGRVNNLYKINEIAKKNNIWVIEDACHSPGGYFINEKGKVKSGSTLKTNLSIFSFHPVKHIAAGEGGMITTNDKKIYSRLINLRTHGIQQDKSKNIKNHGVWYYEMQELGYNYRLTDIQSALGISQLKRAKIGINKRKKIAIKYYEAFKNKDFIISQSGIIDGHAYHLYVIEIKKRNEIIEHLRNLNVICQIHYIPLHYMPYYKSKGYKKGDFPNSESYYNNCLSLPIYPTLMNEEQNFVIDSITKFYNNV